MTLLAWGFDGLLLLGLLGLAWKALNSTDLFSAIALFIAFGLLMALVWVRLEAPDIALAEAAIGAGLSGALLLAALARLRGMEGNVTSNTGVEEAPNNIDARLVQWLSAILLLPVLFGLVYGVLSLPGNAVGLSAEINANLAASGVSNPVTAVLLNFRAYDTLLEVFVLLLALIAIWSMGSIQFNRSIETIGKTSLETTSSVLDTLVYLLVPVLMMVAAYLLWVGAHAPGGAFQAGSVLAAACVLLLLAGWPLHRLLTAMRLRLLAVAGPVVFVSMAAYSLIAEGALLQFPPEHAGTLILLLETVAALSIAVTLAALFSGGQGQHE